MTMWFAQRVTAALPSTESVSSWQKIKEKQLLVFFTMRRSNCTILSIKIFMCCLQLADSKLARMFFVAFNCGKIIKKQIAVMRPRSRLSRDITAPVLFPFECSTGRGERKERRMQTYEEPWRSFSVWLHKNLRRMQKLLTADDGWLPLRVKRSLSPLWAVNTCPLIYDVAREKQPTDAWIKGFWRIYTGSFVAF